MLLTFSRLAAPVLAPLPLLLFLLLIALFLLWRNRRGGAILALLGALALLLVSGYGLGTRNALRALERSFPPFTPASLPASLHAELRHVVVLGNAHGVDPAWPRSAHLSGSSLRRLVEGIDIYRQLPGTKLVLSGGINVEPEPNAEIVADMARRLGVPEQDLLIENRPRDTLEEAALLAPLLGERPFVLVTSAAHMERALRLFEERGLRPLAAPTDFWVRTGRPNDSGAWLPNCQNISFAERILYERLAEIWKRLRTVFAKFPS